MFVDTVLTNSTVSGGESLWDDRVAKTAAVVPRVRAAVAEEPSDEEDDGGWEEVGEIEEEEE